MKLVKIFGGILTVLILVYFLTQNAGENSQVYVNLIFHEYESAPVSMIMLGALTVGVLIGFLAAVVSILSAKNDIRALQNKNRILTDELNDLRNVAIDEGIYDLEDGD
ncbi:MAG: LapA family protein [Candidatus Marinimicrobia bacterium]|nr:LapA family protein [Candidatus Neomarinimicrobiota bacterium]